jgi:hypothetical protein
MLLADSASLIAHSAMLARSLAMRRLSTNDASLLQTPVQNNPGIFNQNFVLSHQALPLIKAIMKSAVVAAVISNGRHSGDTSAKFADIGY